MKKILFGTLFLSILPFYSLSAQEVATRDTINGTPLTITMDPNVNGVMRNMEEKLRDGQ